MSSQVQALQKQVSQLRQEASLQRIMVSQAVTELITFMTANAQADTLINGIGQTENPFRDTKSCMVL